MMPASIRSMSRVLAVAMGVMLLVRPGVAQTHTDYDRRAARALYNSLKPGSVADKKNADPAKLDQPPRRVGNTTAYTINIAGKDGSAMMSGYYRISVNSELSDAAKTGWTVKGDDSATGAQVLFKKVENTTAEKYANYAVRKKIGNVTLTVAMRRPIDEAADPAVADMVRRYSVLFENARENQLFARVVLKITGGDPSREPAEVTAEPFVFSTTAAGKGVKINYSVQVLDSEDHPIPGVKKLKMRLTGPLAKYAKIECERGRADSGSGVVEIRDPRELEKFTLVIAAGEEALHKALFDLAAREDSPKPPIGVKVAAEFQ